MSLSQLKSYLHGRHVKPGKGHFKMKPEDHEEIRKVKRRASRKARKITRGRMK